jgi:hypothetical protein
LKTAWDELEQIWLHTQHVIETLNGQFACFASLAPIEEYPRVKQVER